MTNRAAGSRPHRTEHPTSGSTNWPYSISDDEFLLFQDLIQRETGIQLPEGKRSLLVGRLARRLRALNVTTFAEYYRRVKSDGAEWVQMVDHIVTNETHFFREPKQFEFIVDRVVPALVERRHASRRVRVWSAACSTGEEPFSIAMTLRAQLPGWEIDIVATDLSSRVLAKAREAVWPIERSREIPEPFLKAFMLRGTGAHNGEMKALAELRNLVRFQRLNLNDAAYDVPTEFDLIFCRNVLIYFSREGRTAIVGRLLRHLTAEGHLFLGHAETLNGFTEGLRLVGPTVYAKAGPVGDRSARSDAQSQRAR